EPSPAQRWANALIIRPRTRLVDPAGGPLAIQILTCYDVTPPIPIQARVVFSVMGAGALGQIAVAAAPASGSVTIDRLPPGDHSIRCEVLVADRVLATFRFGLSIVADWKQRLDGVRAAVTAIPNDHSTSCLTLQALLATLDFLGKQQAMETDFPAARLLTEAEELAQSIIARRSYYGPERAGQFWMTLGVGNGGTPVRVLVPEGLKPDRPAAVLVALHGLGGSENLFFDAYGCGVTTAMCKERGWIMVAPRAGGLLDAPPPVAAIVDELARLYPVDRQRIFVLGH